MPIFLAAFLGGLVTAASSIAGRVLLSMGIGLVVFKGMDVMLDGLKTAIMNNTGQLPQTVVGLLGLMKMDVIVSIMFSALACRLAINGLTSGVMKKWVTK
jgi:hypothetical protein